MIETGEILQTLRMIQEEHFDVRTITLGINLDPSGSAHEAGIVSLNPYYFVSDHPLEKLLRLGEQIHPTEPLLKPEWRQGDSYLEWNRELMRTLDQLLGKELKKLHIDYDYEEFMKYICKDEQKPHRARHISPHRKTLDEKRRINK